MFCSPERRPPATRSTSWSRADLDQVRHQDQLAGQPVGSGSARGLLRPVCRDRKPQRRHHRPCQRCDGITGAAALCHQVTGCSATTAKMCTVYDLYHSAAMNKLPATLPQSWYSWPHGSTTTLRRSRRQSGLAGQLRQLHPIRSMTSAGTAPPSSGKTRRPVTRPCTSPAVGRRRLR